jgi:hypothetical protein
MTPPAASFLWRQALRSLPCGADQPSLRVHSKIASSQAVVLIESTSDQFIHFAGFQEDGASAEIRMQWDISLSIIGPLVLPLAQAMQDGISGTHS